MIELHLKEVYKKRLVFSAIMFCLLILSACNNKVQVQCDCEGRNASFIEDQIQKINRILENNENQLLLYFEQPNFVIIMTEDWAYMFDPSTVILSKNVRNKKGHFVISYESMSQSKSIDWIVSDQSKGVNYFSIDIVPTENGPKVVELLCELQCIFAE